MTTLRRLAGILAIAAAAWWWWSAWRTRSRAPADGYPNVWGVRTRPLGRAELAAALEEERAIARRLERFSIDEPTAVTYRPTHRGPAGRLTDPPGPV